MKILTLLLLLGDISDVAAFHLQQVQHSASSCLFGSNRKSSFVEEEAAMKELEEKPAGVVGATFFGGNKQKEELIIPNAIQPHSRHKVLL